LAASASTGPVGPLAALAESIEAEVADLGQAALAGKARIASLHLRTSSKMEYAR
jgi:hypothetical protein